jgi:beta-fructofuranosidase
LNNKGKSTLGNKYKKTTNYLRKTSSGCSSRVLINILKFITMMKHFLLILLACFLIHLSAVAQEKPVLVQTLVNANQPISKEVIKATREFRERLLTDPYRPAYHFCFPEDDGRPGDPNGAFFANGRYHLMFLYNSTGSGFKWGHVSSTDMLNWRYHPDAIGPGNGDAGCFSGGAFVDDDGSAILSYWMLWGDKGIGLAKSTDHNFNQWEKFGNNPVIKSTEWGITEMKDALGKDIHVGSADPSNIWKKDGRYYMVAGNLLVLRKYGSRGKGLPANVDNPLLPNDSLNYQGDQLYLFASDDLKNWKYQHEFYHSERQWTSKNEDNMCPSFLPLPTDPEGGKPSGKHLLLFISHNRGSQYYVGNYKNDHFYPENHGRMTWKDNAYFAPEALIDGKGRQIMWSWIFDDRPDSTRNYYGWAGTYGLPRSLWLGSDGTLRMRPVKELEKLRMKETTLSNVKVNAGSEVKLNEPGNELMELELTIQPNNAKQFGVKVGISDDGREETVIYYDQSDKKLKFDTRKSGLTFGRKIIEEAPMELKNAEPLVLRIFVDKSIVEVFANDRQAIARMVYPTLGGKGISLFSVGGSIETKSFKKWELSPSNPY